MRLIKLELIKWKRTNMSLLLIFIFLFTGIVSPVTTKYSNKIIGYISNSDTKIYFSKITWETLIQNYFKNSSQVILFISIYIICNMCLLPKNNSQKYFYITRVTASKYIYFPKYIASIINLFISLILGGLSSTYMVSSFYSNIKLSYILQALSLQIIGFISLISISIIIAIITNSSFFSATLIELIIIFSGVFNNINTFKKYSPTTLINPTNVINNGVKLTSLPESIYVSILLILFVFCVLYFVNFCRLFRGD